MAVITYTSNDITFDSFDVWSNANFGNNTNITLSNVLTDAYPASVPGDSSVSDIYNRSWFYGNVVSTGNGSVEVTLPYSSGASTSTLIIKNVDYSVYSSITLTATGTYPYNFSEWRTEAGGGGTQISTNAALVLTSTDYPLQLNFYAYFV